MASEALAELALAAAAATIPATCPFSRARVAANEPQAVTETPELALRGNTHVVSEEQAAVLADVGGGERIREFCAQFYRKAFVDEVRPRTIVLVLLLVLTPPLLLFRR